MASLRNRFPIYPLTIIALLALSARASAQSTTLIKGLATDRHGALIAGAEITAASALQLTTTRRDFPWTTRAEAVATSAQSDVATLTVKGQVTDQFDAAVSGATVTVVQAERGVVRSISTDEAGIHFVRDAQV